MRWVQNYDDEDMPVENLQEEMNGYLMDVISDKGVKDLRDTREQVSGDSCRALVPGLLSSLGSRSVLGTVMDESWWRIGIMCVPCPLHEAMIAKQARPF